MNFAKYTDGLKGYETGEAGKSGKIFVGKSIGKLNSWLMKWLSETCLSKAEEPDRFCVSGKSSKHSIL